ncbi:serine protease [Okeania sp. SIO2B3]|uniref:S1 family peptidase n=1 Tax=Okeania sp. SIO2B3 TaxID=2607784 RepID=UPI0013C25601|nr:trypsin-like peptidase domain-containing protein [Okeania sp. SIO2B3]NET44285.1 hypothetical protein [Okeania sp. SIO2B3]
MKHLRRFLGLALLALILTLILANCSLSSEQIFSRLEPSVVRVFYRNVPGHGTGFFVAGEKRVCTVLTAAHVVRDKGERALETKDGKAWDVARVEIFPGGIDLALVTFRPEGRNCNYPALKIGNSDSLNKGSLIHISGFPIGGSNSGPDFILGNVTRFGSFTEGYGISYDALAVGGMSGSPVVDVNGKVVAVHGTSKEGKEGLTFRWGIPINLFQEYQQEEERKRAIAQAIEKQKVKLQEQLEEERQKLEETERRVRELETDLQDEEKIRDNTSSTQPYQAIIEFFLGLVFEHFLDLLMIGLGFWVCVFFGFRCLFTWADRETKENFHQKFWFSVSFFLCGLALVLMVLRNW